MLSKLVVLASLLAAPVLAVNRTVLVGRGGLNYVPANLNASVGDLVTFQFVAGMHNVVQSSLATPCIDLPRNGTTNMTGFDSGYFNLNASSPYDPTWTINITSLAPIYYYCSYSSHCVAGMVGGINVPNATFDSFRAAALSSTNTSRPVTMNNTMGGVGATVIGNGTAPKVTAVAARL